MPQTVPDAIRQVRNRVSEHRDYISSVSETRTRYMLIDPMLQALGWEIADPSQVKVEIDINDTGVDKKADYALYRPGQTEPPWALVEAKRLERVQIDRFQQMQSHNRFERERLWNELGGALPVTPTDTSRWAELNILSPADLMNWSQLTTRRDRVNQIAGYAREFGMNEGYAILTDGDEWVIYELTENQPFPDSPKAVARILIDPAHECAEKLSILRR